MCAPDPRSSPLSRRWVRGAAPQWCPSVVTVQAFLYHPFPSDWRGMEEVCRPKTDWGWGFWGAESADRLRFMNFGDSRVLELFLLGEAGYGGPTLALCRLEDSVRRLLGAGGVEREAWGPLPEVPFLCPPVPCTRRKGAAFLTQSAAVTKGAAASDAKGKPCPLGCPCVPSVPVNTVCAVCEPPAWTCPVTSRPKYPPG